MEEKAFGTEPAAGTLPNQQPVSGFAGKRLVNTFFEGDGTTGKLTSKPFTIEHRFIAFLIGGGHAKETCMNLLVDGKVMHTAQGHDNERLERAFWNVTEFKGKEARLEIVDAATGPWGHVNVDQIVFSDAPAGVRQKLAEQEDFGTIALALLDGRGSLSRTPSTATRRPPVRTDSPTTQPRPSTRRSSAAWAGGLRSRPASRPNGRSSSAGTSPACRARVWAG